MSQCVSRDQELLLWERLISFFYCLLRRFASTVYSPTEGGSEAIQEFGFTGKNLSGLTDFMRKTQFGNSALRVAKTTIDVERESSRKKVGAHAGISATVDETLNPSMKSARNYPKTCVRQDPVKILGCFDYSVICSAPERQAAACFGSLFQSCIVTGWVAKELRALHVEEFTTFIDNLHYAFVVEDNVRPEVGDMVSFLAGCPELRRKPEVLTMFPLSCLCLTHVAMNLPEVRFWSNS